MDQLGKLTTDTLVLFVLGVVSRPGAAFINCSNKTGFITHQPYQLPWLGNLINQHFEAFVSFFSLHMKEPQDKINSCTVV